MNKLLVVLGLQNLPNNFINPIHYDPHVLLGLHSVWHFGDYLVQNMRILEQ